MHIKKQQLEPDMKQWTGSRLGKEYIKAVYCHSAYLTYMQSTSCEILGLDDSQAGIKIVGRNIDNLRYADDTTLMAESEEVRKSLWWGCKRRWKKWLKTQHSENESHGIRSYHLVANRWGKVKTVIYFIFLVSKITEDGNFSHKVRRYSLL